MTIDEAITTARREWRKLGVPSKDRRAFAADLRLDLEAAVADGVTADQVIDGNVKIFARRLAAESGVRHVPPRYGRVVATVLAGAVAGMVVGVLIAAGVYTVLTLLGLPGDFNAPTGLAICLYYAGIGLVGLGGAVVGVLILLRRVPGIGRTAAAIAVLTPLAAGAVVPIVVLFARSTGYSTSPPIVLIEVVLSVSGVTAATVMARRWSLTQLSEVRVSDG